MILFLYKKKKFEFVMYLIVWIVDSTMKMKTNDLNLKATELKMGMPGMK